MKLKSELETNVNIRVTYGENEALEEIARTRDTHLIEVFVDDTLVFIEKTILNPDVPPTSTGVAGTVNHMLWLLFGGGETSYYNTNRVTAEGVRREVEKTMAEILKEAGQGTNNGAANSANVGQKIGFVRKAWLKFFNFKK